jgi:hypothetical protein
MEPRILITGAVLSAVGVAGLIGYQVFLESKWFGLAGLVCLLVGVALIIVYCITGRAR